MLAIGGGGGRERYATKNTPTLCVKREISHCQVQAQFRPVFQVILKCSGPKEDENLALACTSTLNL